MLCILTTFETDIIYTWYIYTSQINTRCQVHMYVVRILMRVASDSVGCFPGAWQRGALGIFKSPVCTHNQAWTFSFCPLHTMTPAERSALYVLLLLLLIYRYDTTAVCQIPIVFGVMQLVLAALCRLSGMMTNLQQKRSKTKEQKKHPVNRRATRRSLTVRLVAPHAYC